MRTLSPFEFVAEVTRRATELPPRHLDPAIALIGKARSDTLESKAIGRAVIGIIKGTDLDEADVFALGPTALGWLAAFADRWKQSDYSDAELDELVRLLEGSGK
jgi:hypothetical protein